MRKKKDNDLDHGERAFYKKRKKKKKANKVNVSKEIILLIGLILK